MNKLAKYAFVFSALVAPVMSFAQQTNDPVSRAQVRADLIRLEKAGYNQGVHGDASYPAEIQAAEAKVAAEDEQAAQRSGMGGVPATTSDSGSRHRDSTSPRTDECVGPASYCNIYFGG